MTLFPESELAISTSDDDKSKTLSEDKLSAKRVEKQLEQLTALKESVQQHLPEDLLEEIETLEMFQGLTSQLDTIKRCKLASKLTRMIQLTLPRYQRDAEIVAMKS